MTKLSPEYISETLAMWERIYHHLPISTKGDRELHVYGELADYVVQACNDFRDALDEIHRLRGLLEDPWFRLVPGVEYTFDEVNRLLDRGPNTKSSQGKILSAIADGELMLTLDWKIKRR